MNILKNIEKSKRSRSLLVDTFGYILYKMNFGSKYSVGLCTMDKIYYKIEKKYNKFVRNYEVKEEIEKNRVVSDYVWIFWYQNLEEAPILVKKCIESIQKNLKEKRIIIIDKSNFSEYVNIPAYILEKFEKGIISITHFSDILRAVLLYEYGGLWLDATVFCTDQDIKYIESNDLFVYRNGWFENENINSASWLIYAKYSNNNIIGLTYELLKEYWKKNNYLCNYFLFHMFFKLATERFSEDWKKVPYYNHIDNHLLAYELNNNYNEKRFREIKKITNFHKLSYKMTINNKKSFFNKIILEEKFDGEEII